MSADTAKKLGLPRDDAVQVSGPDAVEFAGEPVDITIRIAVPAAAKSDVVEVMRSGDCVSSFDGQPPDVTKMTVAVAEGLAAVVVRASIAAGATECHVTIDALVPDRPETGDGHTVSVLRRRL